mmetsp:Transcript_80696/g.160320  ORF Transcript_80696/g.160320 Transcript_80696/m.160320 type:complete len:95 (+) Transcript_80696:644-928(+)
MEASVRASAAAVGSSANRSGASRSRARATTVRCFSPPDSRPPRSPTRVLRPLGSASTVCVREAAAMAASIWRGPASRLPICTFHSSVSSASHGS